MEDLKNGSSDFKIPYMFHYFNSIIEFINYLDDNHHYIFLKAYHTGDADCNEPDDICHEMWLIGETTYTEDKAKENRSGNYKLAIVKVPPGLENYIDEQKESLSKRWKAEDEELRGIEKSQEWYKKALEQKEKHEE